MRRPLLVGVGVLVVALGVSAGVLAGQSSQTFAAMFNSVTVGTPEAEALLQLGNPCKTGAGQGPDGPRGFLRVTYAVWPSERSFDELVFAKGWGSGSPDNGGGVIYAHGPAVVATLGASPYVIANLCTYRGTVPPFGLEWWPTQVLNPATGLTSCWSDQRRVTCTQR